MMVNPIDRSQLVTNLRQELEIDPLRTAILAIDVNRGHLDPDIATMPIDPIESARVLERITQLFAFSRRHQIPIIYVMYHGWEIPGIGRDMLNNPFQRAVTNLGVSLSLSGMTDLNTHGIEGSPQAEVMPQIAPQSGDYVLQSKRRLSAFYGTELDILLRVLNVETLVMVGINTNTCVLCSSFEAANRDFQVVVVDDCVASMYGDDLHRFALENVKRCFGWVFSEEEIEEMIARGLS